MEMLELAAELKWCRERITALEAERDRLLYSERLHNEALGTAVQEAELLRAELAECKRDAERYRWIRGNVPSHSTRWSRWKVEYFYGASGWNDLRHAKLDAEIDAALAAKGK